MADPALADFINRLRILRSIDMDELIERGPDSISDDAKRRIWLTFSEDPYRWLMRASDVDAEHVWDILQRRSRTFPVVGKFTIGSFVHTLSYGGRGPRIAQVARAAIFYQIQYPGQSGPGCESYADDGLVAAPKIGEKS